MKTVKLCVWMASVMFLWACTSDHKPDVYATPNGGRVTALDFEAAATSDSTETTTKIDLQQQLLKDARKVIYQGYYDSAVHLAQKVLEMQHQNPSVNNIIAETYNVISEAYREARELKKATQAAQKAICIGEKQMPVDSLAIATGYVNLSAIALWNGRYELAQKKLAEALDIKKRIVGEGSPDVADIYNLKGTIDRFQGHYKQAEASHKQALEIGWGGSHPNQARAYYQLGKNYEDQGKYEESVHFHLKAISIYQAAFGEACVNLAFTYRDLATTYSYLGSYLKSRDAFQKALRIGSQILGEDHSRLSSTYNNFGLLYYHRGAWDQALLYLKRALRIRLKNPDEDQSFLGGSYNNLGIVYLMKGEYEQALSFLKKALEINREVKGENHPSVIGTYSNISNVYRRLGNYEKTLEYRNMVLQMYLKAHGKNHFHVAVAYRSLGFIHESLGNNEQALGYYQKSLETYTVTLGENHPYTVQAHSDVGRAHREIGHYDRAFDLQRKVCRMLRYNFEKPTDFSSVTRLDYLENAFFEMDLYYTHLYQDTKGVNYLDSLRNLYRNWIALKDYRQREYVIGATRQFYVENSLSTYEYAIANLNMIGSREAALEAFQISERAKNRQLTERLQRASNLTSFGIPPDIKQQEEKLRKDLNRFEKKIFQEEFGKKKPNDSLLEVYKDSLFDIRIQREIFLRELKQSYPDYYRLRYSQHIVDMEWLQDNLIDGLHQAVVEYFTGRDSIYAFVIDSDTLHILSFARDFPLDQWVTDLRCALLAEQDTALRCSASYAPTAYQLYQRLFAPVDSLLSAQASVLIVPDGVLGYLPFETLLTKPPDPGSTYADYPYLLRDHPLSYAYSATLQREMQRKQHPQPPRRNLLAVAPAFEGNLTAQDTALLASRFIDTTDRRNYLTPLRHNVDEAENIAAQLGGDALLGEEATEAAFVQQAGHYRILHLSTHGKANDQAGDYSFLAFHPIEDDSAEVENEWLYNQELYNLQLNADLVVLSACETGIGELQRGEGIISLARGFSYAGAKSLVTSLWNVNDRSTKELMESFYGYLAEGRPKHEALRQAKLDYLATHPAYLQSPFFWAAFIPIGDMKAVEVKRDYTWWWVGGLGVSLLLIGLLGLWYARRS